MRKVFLDVGASKGQALKAVLDPALRFDEIHCFEPARSCYGALRKWADKRVVTYGYGLWNKTCVTGLYSFGEGSAGASVYLREGRREREWCHFYQASRWFADHVVKGDVVFLKLNVEGAECDILDDLLDSGEFSKVTYAMIDFDVRKIPAQRHREAELRERLAAYSFPRVAFSKQVMIGATH